MLVEIIEPGPFLKQGEILEMQTDSEQVVFIGNDKRVKIPVEKLSKILFRAAANNDEYM